MWHTWTSHGTHMDEPCRTCARDRVHTCMSHVTHMNAPYLTRGWVTSHICMSRVAHINESRRTCVWVVTHIWTRHVMNLNESQMDDSRMRESRTSHEWVTNESRISHEEVTNESRMSHNGTKMYESRYNQNESCHVAHMNAPCLTFEQFMSWQAHQRCRVEDKLALGGLRGQSWVKCADSTSVCVCVLRVCLVCVWL